MLKFFPQKTPAPQPRPVPAPPTQQPPAQQPPPPAPEPAALSQPEGENADIRGEIKTKSVTVLGKVNGNITVGERCELKARAHLVGDLKAARLVIEEGATFVGKSEVTSGGKGVPAKTATPNGDATFTGGR